MFDSKLINNNKYNNKDNNKDILYLVLKKKKTKLNYPSFKIDDNHRWDILINKINLYISNLKGNEHSIEQISDELYNICKELLKNNIIIKHKHNKKIIEINKIISQENSTKYQPKFKGNKEDLNLHFQELNTCKLQNNYNYISDKNDNIKTIINDDFHISELTEYLELKKSIKNNYDGLCNELVRRSEPLQKKLIEIFNNLINKGKIPQSWSYYYIYNFYKGTGDTNDSKNYRPIVKLDTFSKIFWGLINKKLKLHISNNKIININYQKEFKKGVRGVEENRYIHENIKLKSNLVLYLDIKNAYGSIEPNLVKDILKYYKLPEKYTLLIHNYLQNRYAIFEKYIKHWNYGLPQGLCLSNQLFILCLNYIVEKFYQKFKIEKYGVKYGSLHAYFLLQLFSDDIVIYGKNINDMQLFIDYLSELMNKFNIKFNHSKSYIDYIDYDLKEITSLKINEHVISILNKDSDFKYLGQYARLDTKFEKNILKLKSNLDKIKEKLQLIENINIDNYLYAYQQMCVNKLRWFFRVNNLNLNHFNQIKSLEIKWVLDINNGEQVFNEFYFTNRINTAIMSRHEALTKSFDLRIVNIYGFSNSINFNQIENMVKTTEFKIPNYTLDDGVGYQ